MRVTQQCASCKHDYAVPDSVYRIMRTVSCRACGHENVKQAPVNRRCRVLARVAKDLAGNVVFVDGKKTAGGASNTRCKSGPPPIPKSTGVQTLENLRRMVEETGKCFIFGDNPAIARYDLDMTLENRIPSIGLGRAFEYFPRIYATVLDDAQQIRESLPAVKAWQDEHRGRWLFWRHETGDVRWISKNNLHGFSHYADGNKVDAEKTELKNVNVQYYATSSEVVQDFEIPVRLAGASAVDSAINLAYLLGAREVVLVHTDEPTVDFSDLPIAVKTVPGAHFEAEANTEEPVYIRQLRGKIERASGKCFILGGAPSLKKLNLSLLFGFPVIACNACFQGFPHADAVIFGDKYFIEKWQGELERWQRLSDQKPVVFWQEYGGGSKLQRVFGYHKGQPSKLIHDNPEGRVMPIFSLKHSIITAAINCAFWLGAREIFLLGTEFGAGHFYDTDGKIYKDLGKIHDHFPHAPKIVDFVDRQAKELLSRGCAVYTCWDGECLLKGRVPYLPLETAADNRYLTQLWRGAQ